MLRLLLSSCFLFLSLFWKFLEMRETGKSNLENSPENNPKNNPKNNLQPARSCERRPLKDPPKLSALILLRADRRGAELAVPTCAGAAPSQIYWMERPV
jgi:hypothetical protein